MLQCRKINQLFCKTGIYSSGLCSLPMEKMFSICMLLLLLYVLCYLLKRLIAFFPLNILELGQWKPAQVQRFIASCTAPCMCGYTTQRAHLGSGISPPLVTSHEKQKHWRHLSRAVASDMPLQGVVSSSGWQLAEMTSLGMSTELQPLLWCCSIQLTLLRGLCAAAGVYSCSKTVNSKAVVCILHCSVNEVELSACWAVLFEPASFAVSAWKPFNVGHNMLQCK